MMNENISYKVVGISNDPDWELPEAVTALLSESHNFSGGERHYKLVEDFLPEQHDWIEIKGSMDDLFRRYATRKSMVIFASGDPLFYGIVRTIQTYHPLASIEIFPWFNSLQVLCHKCKIPYNNLQSVSVHGRSWNALDQALIKRTEFIGVLTDEEKNPSAIAQRMLEYNFNNYQLVVGESLEGKEEVISNLTIEEASRMKFHSLNCMLLIETQKKPKFFGIPDNNFQKMEGRSSMITKMPIRLASLSALALYNKKVLWDIGFCTASVSIEAKNLFPQLSIFSFEKRAICAALFDTNTKALSVPGIFRIMEDFLSADLKNIPPPDAIFIGGHGNQLRDMIQKIDDHLLVGGRIVMNAVQSESIDIFIKSIQDLNYIMEEPMTLTIDHHNTITVLAAQKI